MSMISLKTEGVEDLLRTLQAMPQKLTRAVIVEALTRVAEPMRARMAANAPRGDEAPHLADNIAISPVTKFGNVQAGGGAAKLDPDEYAVAVGPTKDLFYGFFDEFGTARQAAQPFMRPAFDEEINEAIQQLADEVWNVIKAGL